MQDPSLLTTAEIAAYLRVKERTIYEMVNRQTIPFTRVTGKLLFPRRLIDAWVEAQTEHPAGGPAAPPPIYAGSNDPLLEWALRESGSGLAVLASGSGEGLAALAEGQAVLAGCHLLDPESGEYNLPAVRARLSGGIVVIHWARREQGLLVAPGNPLGITDLSDVAARGLRLARRTAGSGSERLLDVLLTRAGLTPMAVQPAARRVATHADLATMVATGEADCGLGLKAVAGPLGFLPLIADECFDLVLRRRDYFEAPVQALLRFARGPDMAARAARLGGYDLTDLGAVRWNG
ncbi:substrate-binding domain-containing protein [Plastorhodobacter daqingensis]|uniref:Substrate-binding domain-containing protein n=1 Tax=Plastorhodobacter daqingensis TaxID=1387281 RepID=A0ABW2UI41_9RHOB